MHALVLRTRSNSADHRQRREREVASELQTAWQRGAKPVIHRILRRSRLPQALQGSGSECFLHEPHDVESLRFGRQVEGDGARLHSSAMEIGEIVEYRGGKRDVNLGALLFTERVRE